MARKNVISLLLVGVVLASTVGVVGGVSTSDAKNDVTCEDYNDREYGLAVISYSNVSNAKMFWDARAYAEASLEKCNLPGREETELAGEVRAHAIGEYTPDFLALDPGETVDMIGENDPQHDMFGWLMGSADSVPSPPKPGST